MVTKKKSPEEVRTNKYLNRACELTFMGKGTCDFLHRKTV